MFDVGVIKNTPNQFKGRAGSVSGAFVDMRATRTILALSLATVLNAPLEETRVGVFRM